jgi:hypothetical protein
MDTLTISMAKARLGRLADRTLKTGQPVLIRRGHRFVQLLPWVPVEPIPLHPEGSLPVSSLARALENLAGPDYGPLDR